MAFRTAAGPQFLGFWLAVSSLHDSGSRAQGFQLLQPQDAVSVTAGETLTLTCSVTGDAPVGPTKWFKDSGPGRQLVYADAGSFPQVTRAVPGSDTDFTIRIPHIQPKDTGVYRCVKFKKGTGPDEEIRSGAGTTVSLSDSRPVSAVPAAVGTACVLLVILLLSSIYLYWRKKRGRSPCPARSQAPFPDNWSTRRQPSDEKEPDILYADLQHSGGPQKPKKSIPEERSEYAAIKVTQSGAG